MSICLKCCFIFLYIWKRCSEVGNLVPCLFKRKMRFLKGDIQISSLLCRVVHSFAQFARCCQSCCSSGLNVAWVGDSQTHEGRYIYRINSTLHPQHNSCLLTLSWLRPRACSHLQNPVIEQWRRLYVRFALSMLEINTEASLCTKANTCSGRLTALGLLVRSPPLCSVFHFLMSSGHLIPTFACWEAAVWCNVKWEKEQVIWSWCIYNSVFAVKSVFMFTAGIIHSVC